MQIIQLFVLRYSYQGKLLKLKNRGETEQTQETLHSAD